MKGNKLTSFWVYLKSFIRNVLKNLSNNIETEIKSKSKLKKLEIKVENILELKKLTLSYLITRDKQY